MNDISVKPVESPKEPVAEAEVVRKEVDPLAIEEISTKQNGNGDSAIESIAEIISLREVKESASVDVDLTVPEETQQKDEVEVTPHLSIEEEKQVEITQPLEVPSEVTPVVVAPIEIVPVETKISEVEPKYEIKLIPKVNTEKKDEIVKQKEQASPPAAVEKKEELEIVREVAEKVETKEELKETKASSPREIPAILSPPVTEEPMLSPVENPKETSNIEIPIEAKSVIPPEVKILSPIPTPISKIPEEVVSKPKTDVEMMEVVVEKLTTTRSSIEEKPPVIRSPAPEKQEQKEAKAENKTVPVNGDVAKDDQPAKRRASEEVDTESPLKKLCQEVERTFPHHDTMINDYIQTATKNNIDEIQRHTEQLLAEIQTLRELAQKKEHEWNNILHLKKVKEEILLRLLRRKQVLSFEKSAEMNGSDRLDPFDYLNQPKNLAIDKSDEISGLSIKQTGSASPMMQPVMPVTTHFNPMSGLPPPYDKAHMQMHTPVFPQAMMIPGQMPGFPRDMNMNGQLPTSFGLPMGRQGPTKDVKSIIADYRQKNPDITPRRGRRMKSILKPNMMNVPPRPIAPKMDPMNMNNLNNLNMIFNNLDVNQKAMLERLQQIQAGGLPNSIFKDALVQFASMQGSAPMLARPPEPPRPEHHAKEPRRRPERCQEQPEPPHASSSPRLPPPPYPEISLLPVTPAPPTPPTSTGHDAHSSLLHGILTKAPPASQAYSPTLAKLLTSPETRQSAALPTFGQAKNCGEITITPVQPAPAPAAEAPPEKTEEVVQLDDEESPASETSPAGSPLGSGGRLVIDEAAEEPPLCQGCRRRDAQFVCAGCANQWYCSRDCQVAAWDEHSEMCSG